MWFTKFKIIIKKKEDKITTENCFPRGMFKIFSQTNEILSKIDVLVNQN